jgi:RND family efflux transporter MFP subunit
MFKPVFLLSALVSATIALPASAQQADSAVPVSVKRVEQRMIQRTLPVSGRIHSRHDVELSLTVSGELKKVAEPGSNIKKGELIAALDSQPILLRLKEMRARAQREKTNGEFLIREAERLRALKESNAASQRMLDEAENQYQLSQADIKAMQSQIQQLEDEHRRSRLVAAFDGVVAERFLKSGEYLQAGNRIVRLIDPADLEVRFDVPVAYATRIKVGDSIVFKNGEEASSARITTLLPAVDPQSQTFEVRAKLQKDDALLAGQLVRVELGVNGHNALMIPRDAVVLRQNGSYVFRISAGNKAERVEVTLGEGEQDWVSVQGELQQGDSVAVRGMERLQNGQSVTTDS